MGVIVKANRNHNCNQEPVLLLVRTLHRRSERFGGAGDGV